MADGTPSRAAAVGVAVVGGGWAGCAAAVTLAASGVPVTLVEQARTLGGRARRVQHRDLALDNGQHLVIGAYRQTLELISLVHDADRAARLFRRFPLTLRPFGAARPDAIALTAWKVRSPFNVAGALLFARGLGIAERIALAGQMRGLARAGFDCAPGETVAQRFSDSPQRVFAAVWAPLCLAALNTPPERASARIFAEVLRNAFTGAAGHSDFLVPTVDLSACFPEAAARFVTARGGVVRHSAGVRSIVRTAGGVALEIGGVSEPFTAVIVAVGPHQLAATVGSGAQHDGEWRATMADVSALGYESITTIYLGFAGPVDFSAPMLRLDDAPGQWAFDRSGLLGATTEPHAQSLVAVVISAGGPHDAHDQASLARIVEAQLRRLAPDLPPVLWSRVIAERRATYACTPGLRRPRPGRISPGIYLAGDYTDAELPATLEAATRSGVAAARALIGDRRDLASATP